MKKKKMFPPKQKQKVAKDPYFAKPKKKGRGPSPRGGGMMSGMMPQL